ncbi:DUF4382 domain-containing protein [Formosa haliotis]|uniref:DUF4382 domain-containing protein n=1 Tax=Formosa haliotis TaxID=1555194 RepID=UPI000824DB94|nr:DUF4382 domain-containing protein [Formosa haliotis]
MKITKYLKILSIAILALTFFNCSDDDNNEGGSDGPARISVKLMDNPGDYEHVYVDVQDVMIKTEDTENEEDGWQSLDAINTGVYDLLELTGGINVLLVDEYEIPAGELKEIRLILGEDNTIVIDGETFPLNTPSAQQSGLKIKVNEVLEPNISYTFLLDFDVDKSIVVAGNSGNINLKPVIRATVEAETGAISGMITPNNIQTLITATCETESVTTFANPDGEFLILGLKPGTYTISIYPDETSGYIEQTIENVLVSLEETTDLGTIILE